MKFAQKHLPHAQFFLIEKVLPTLYREGYQGNVLDVENKISELADKIIIVLESESAFTELGVFSHGKLRDKLIVINNSKFKDSKSFINVGPLKAIVEASNKDSIIDYRMSEDGVFQVDAIGDTFAPLFEILKKPIQKKSSAISLNECNPGTEFSKKSVMMVHDLVYFSGPVSHKELVEILLIIFGKRDFKVKKHVATLVAIDSLTRTRKGWYKSCLGKPYYRYKFDIHNLISVYRNYMLKYFPERLNGH